MTLEELEKVLSQEERQRITSEVVAEQFQNLPKRRKQDENK
ncbi:hypothetical protein [Jeotgalibaca porci]